MNDVISQLIGVAPGIGAGLTGNGRGMNAFMEGYLRTKQMLDENQRRDSELQMRDRDRHAVMTRQQEQDRIAEENRRVNYAGLLNQAGAQAESVPGAESEIEAIFSALSPLMQEQMAPARDARLRAVVPQITASQKQKAIAWMDRWAKSPHAEASNGQPPIVRNMPPFLSALVGGATEAPLSDIEAALQTTIDTPKPKERMPAAAGSFEEYSDPVTSPERKKQIEADRKAYMQSDDKPTVNVTLPGGISGKAGDAALKFQDDYARDSKPYLTMRDAYQRVQSASARPDAAGDLSLIFAYMKMLDPNSVVREQEFANAQNAAGVPDQIRNLYNRVKDGVRLNPEQRTQFVAQAEALFDNARTNQRGVRTTYSSRAKQWGIPENMVLDVEDALLSAPSRAASPPSPANARGPKPGERRKIRGQLAEWDGQGWLPVKP